MRARRGGAVVLFALLALGARAAPAQPDPSSMRTRVLACTACHGEQGRATPQGYFPRIAGKPEGYLYNQLLNFRDGRRSYPQMSYLLEHMTDEYLGEIARHFAGLRLPYAPAPAPRASRQVLDWGRQLVQQGDADKGIPACVRCHGPGLMGASPWLPGLLGLSPDYVASQLGAWQTGQRRAQAPDCMAVIARRMSARDVSAVAAWLAAQPPPAGAAPEPRMPVDLPMRCGGVELPARADGTVGGLP